MACPKSFSYRAELSNWTTSSNGADRGDATTLRITFPTPQELFV
jgi:hypothetical protein